MAQAVVGRGWLSAAAGGGAAGAGGVFAGGFWGESRFNRVTKSKSATDCGFLRRTALRPTKRVGFTNSQLSATALHQGLLVIAEGWRLQLCGGAGEWAIHAFGQHQPADAELAVV